MSLNYFLLIAACILHTSVLAQDKLVMKKYYNYSYTVERSTNNGEHATFDTILNHINQVSLPYFISSDKVENDYLTNYIHLCALDSDTFNMNTLNADWISPLESKKPATTKIYYKKRVLSEDILSIIFYKNEYDCCQNSTSLTRQFNYPFTLDRNTNKILLLKDVIDTVAFKKEYHSILSTIKKNVEHTLYEQFITSIKFHDLLNSTILLDHNGITFYLPVKTNTDKMKEYSFIIEDVNHKHLLLPYVKKYMNSFPPESYTVDVE